MRLPGLWAFQEDVLRCERGKGTQPDFVGQTLRKMSSSPTPLPPPTRPALATRSQDLSAA